MVINVNIYRLMIRITYRDRSKAMTSNCQFIFIFKDDKKQTPTMESTTYTHFLTQIKYFRWK